MLFNTKADVKIKYINKKPRVLSNKDEQFSKN